MLGCGNSKLSEEVRSYPLHCVVAVLRMSYTDNARQMYDDGYHSIVNTDVSLSIPLIRLDSSFRVIVLWYIDRQNETQALSIETRHGVYGRFHLYSLR